MSMDKTNVKWAKLFEVDGRQVLVFMDKKDDPDEAENKYLVTYKTNTKSGDITISSGNEFEEGQHLEFEAVDEDNAEKFIKMVDSLMSGGEHG